MNAIKLPPQSIEIEQSYLAACLLGDAEECLEHLPKDRMYRTSHNMIYNAIATLVENNQEIDINTLIDVLKDKDQAEGIGGLRYLGHLLDCPRSINIKTHADKINEKYKKRKIIELSHEMSKMCFDNSPSDEVIGFFEGKLKELDTIRKGGFQRISDVVEESMEKLELVESGEMIGVPTGFKLLDSVTGGLQRGDFIVVGARPAMGKAQPKDCNILMANGEYKQLGRIKIGDKVASIDGKESVVTGVYPQGIKQVYGVQFSDGRYTECCLDHWWRINNRKWVSPKHLKTWQIIELLKKPSYKNRIWVGCVNGEFGHNKPLPIHPWAFGALLANGYWKGTSVKYSTQDAQNLHTLQKLLPNEVIVKYVDKYDYRLVTRRGSPNPLKNAIRDLDIDHCVSINKIIPDIYLTANKENRLDLLRGLMDNDGWVEKSGTLRYSTSSYSLAQCVQYLVRSLGGNCSIKQTFPSYTYKGEKREGQKHYICKIRHNEPKEFVSLYRKNKRASNHGVRLNISSINKRHATPCICISVSHHTGLYITDDFIVTHNTSFAMNIAKRASAQNFGVAVFSLEQPNVQLADRLLADMAKVDLQKFKVGGLSKHEWEKISNSASELYNYPLFVDDESVQSVGEMKRKIRVLNRKHKLDLILLDYIQLGREKGERRDLEIAEITRGCKLIAKEFNVPFIALSQLNRQVETRPNKRPVLSDLRESGTIEQDSDVVMFLYRDEYYNEDTDDKGIAEVIIAKYRNGKTGTIRLSWIDWRCAFEDLAF